MESLQLYIIKSCILQNLRTNFWVGESSIKYLGNLFMMKAYNFIQKDRGALVVMPLKNLIKNNASSKKLINNNNKLLLKEFTTSVLCKDLLLYANTTLYLLLSDIEEVSGCRTCINIIQHKKLFLTRDNFYVFSLLYRIYYSFCRRLHINLAVFLKFLLIAVESEDVELLITAINGLFPFYSFAQFPAIMAMLQNIIAILWAYFNTNYGVVGFRCSLTGKIGRRLLTRANTLRFSFGNTSGGTASIRLVFKQHQVQSRTGAFGLTVGVYYK